MKCEYCNKEHDGSFGSGRFCSGSCRSAFNAKKVKHRGKPRPEKRKAFGTWKCQWCGLVFDTKTQLVNHKREVHPIQKGSSWNKGVHLSEEEKKRLSDLGKELFKKGILKGWQTRKKISFPEKFWKRVLDNNSIPYQFQLRISHKELGLDSRSCYFLDFALPGKVDLEIDGAQHRFRKEHDDARNKNLENNGWTVYRIDWNDVTSDNGKLKMKEKIDRFLTWYKNFNESFADVSEK